MVSQSDLDPMMTPTCGSAMAGSLAFELLPLVRDDDMTKAGGLRPPAFGRAVVGQPIGGVKTPSIRYTVAFDVCTFPQTTLASPLTLKSSPLPETSSISP